VAIPAHPAAIPAPQENSPDWVKAQKAKLQEAETAVRQIANSRGCHVGVISRWSHSLGNGYIECKEMAQQFGGDVQIFQPQIGDLEVSDSVLFQVGPDLGKGAPRKALVAKKLTELSLHRRRILKVEVPCPDPGTAETPQEYLGFISSYGPSAGFGFISCAQTRQIYSAEVYIHRDQFMDCSIGDAVHFRVALNSKGVPVARGVRKAVSAAGAPPLPAAAPSSNGAKKRSRSRSMSESMSISGERKDGKSSKRKSKSKSASRDRRRNKRSKSRSRSRRRRR
jgi:hypothetical protein